MEKLGILDIPFLVKNRGGSIHDAIVVGVLRGEVEPPPHFAGLQLRERNDRFAVVDLVGIVTQTGKYYARGQILTVVHRSLLEVAKTKESGRLAISLSEGAIRVSNRGEVTNFVSMARWSKGQHNTWQVGKVTANGFKQKDFPEFFAVVANAYKHNWQFSYPVDVPETYTDSCLEHDFVLVNEPQGHNPIANLNQGVTERSTTPPHNEPQVSPSSLGGAPETLGTSNASNISDLMQNRAVTHGEVKNKSRFKVENRYKLEPKTKNAKLMETAIDQADKKVATIIENLTKFESDEDTPDTFFEDEIIHTAERLKKSWNKRTGEFTGRQLFKTSIERTLPDYTTKDANNNSVIDTTLTAMGTALVDQWVSLTDENDNKFLGQLYEHRIKVYLNMIELLLGIRGKLVDSLGLVREQGINLLSIMKENPYNLCFIDPRIDIEDLDKLAMLYGVNLKDQKVITSRNVAYMHNFMLDSSNRIIGDNTVVKYGQLLYNVVSGYILSKRSYDNLTVEGVTVKKTNIQSLHFYINPETKEQNFQLPREGWKPRGRRFVLQNGQDSKKVMQDYTDSGLGVVMDLNNTKYVSDFIFAKKEMYIYNRLRELSTKTKTKDITDEEIKKCVVDFETIKAKEFNMKPGEFKLEQRQAEAVSLLRNPIMCLTGPAGSGKTTTAEALVYGAEQLLDIQEDEIMFAAPTGKAANRLKEVVKRKTRTINSLFGIGGDGVSLKDPENLRKKDDIKLLIVDETSMPNVNLMYEMMLRVENGTRIFFLGDKEQLPPIGFGKPFATMLTFLPTVVLNVSKRASDNSGITSNARKVIYESDGVIEDLENKPDFRIVNDKNMESVVTKVANICNYHLGKGEPIDFNPIESLGRDLDPDDIQVISPINKHNWGTVALNKMLQDIFNPRVPRESYVSFARSPYEKVEFRKNDRVIHTRVNQPNRTRLSQVDGPQFVLESTTGINNGEVGKVVGFYNAKALDFSSETNPETEDRLKEEFKGSENVYYMAVQYNDVDEETAEPIEFVILYRMELINYVGQQMDVISYELNNLDLAYALTVHKLQGSEAKLVIVLMLPVGRGGFISRNMIYTAITRGKEGDYLVGDVLGKGSCINQGRKIEQTDKRYTNLDNL